MRALTKLLWPFPQKVIHTNPSGGGSYVAHPVVEQRLLDVLGGPPDTEVVEVVRGFVKGQAGNPDGKSVRARTGTSDLDNAVVGVLLRMSASLDEGRFVSVVEAGDCEDPHNWTTDGQRLKDAMSDAYKRCAMRLGVGLHLWAGDAFYLAEKLAKQDEETEQKPSETKADISGSFPLGRADAAMRLVDIFHKGGSSVPTQEASDLLKAMNAPDELTAREWAALANAADDIVKAFKVAS